jgi:hypothetical protein
MHLWNQHWLLLLALFIDWERLADLLLGRLPAVETPPVRLGAGQLVQAGWLTLFIGTQLYVSFTFRADRRWTFPLTSFPMYSTVYAEPPFTEHRPYTLHGSRWHIDADPPLTRAEYNGVVWQTHYSMPWLMPDLHPLAMQIKGNLERTSPGRVIKAMTIEKTAFEIPPYPDNRVVPAASALAYRFTNGTHVGLPYELTRDKASRKLILTLNPAGLTRPTYRFGVYRHFRGEPVELPGALAGNRFTFTPPDRAAGPYYVVIWVRDPALGEGEVLFGGPALY